MTEVAVRVGRQTKWISGLTEATTCKVRWEKHRLQTIYELDAARVQNLLGTGFPSRWSWSNMQSILHNILLSN